MKKSIIGLVAVGTALIVAALFFVGAIVSANNSATRMEAGIIAAHDQSRNVLGQYAPKLREALGVASLQAEAVEDIITAANESRYGGDGSQATKQWIREQNPNLDQRSYGRVIEMIEAGRTDFMTAQEIKLDRVRVYRTSLAAWPGAFFYGIVGKPTPGFIEKYEQIVISGDAERAFTTMRDDGVDVTK